MESDTETDTKTEVQTREIERPSDVLAPVKDKDWDQMMIDAINGDHYIGSQEGEVLDTVPANVYLFPPGMPSADTPNVAVDMTLDQTLKFVQVNAAAIRQAVTGLSAEDAIRLAYVRALAVKSGLVSPKFSPATYFVKYREALQITGSAYLDGYDWTPDSKAMTLALSDDIVRKLTLTFTDRVCMVAFVFRARGHHWMDSYADLYNRLWMKCRYNLQDVVVSHQHVATLGLHAVFPIILDDFWAGAVRRAECNGTLIKRFDVAAAGAAGPAVLKKGIDDVRMIAPGIQVRFEEEIKYLNQVIDQLSAHRFKGSVNARYYGVERGKFDEGRLASVGATIYAALEGLADDAPLAQSAALRRIAQNAPITGAVLGRAIRNISDRPEVADVLLIAPE